MKWKWVFVPAFIAQLSICAICNPSDSDPARKVDADLSDAIGRMQLDFGAHLKRAFTNSHIRSNGIAIQQHQVILDQTFFQDGGNDVMIKNLRTTRSESPRLLSINADMLQDILVLTVDFGALSLECEYEVINEDVMSLLPVSSSGILNATISNTRAHGRVGYIMNGDIMEARNFDLQYDIGQIYLETLSSDDIQSQSTRESIDETIFKGIRRDIEQYFEEQLHQQLGHVLEDVSLMQLFGENGDLVRKHVTRSKERALIINGVIDSLLEPIRQQIIEQRYAQISIEGFKKSFKKKVGYISVWGTFEASGGWVGDMSTIYRTGDFSVHTEGVNVTIFGALGLGEFSGYYSKYKAKFMNVGPSGRITVTTGKNSAKLKLTTNGWITGIEDIKKIINLDFNLEKVDNVRVYITGLGLLNSVVSTFITWIVAIVKNDVLKIVNKMINNLIRNYLGISS
uniref:Putative 50 kDa midgut protein n=1 Tax=Nyssomyia neivai TaxID=330878 RepID=A0A1L8DNM6_9DIPT